MTPVELANRSFPLPVRWRSAHVLDARGGSPEACPAAQANFEEVPPERRTDYVDLLYGTDHAGYRSPGAEVPYGQDHARSIGFGSARVSQAAPADDLG